ncbi:MAG: glycosyltransferase family 9 protein [Acetobacteraceae bacterium]
MTSGDGDTDQTGDAASLRQRRDELARDLRARDADLNRLREELRRLRASPFVRVALAAQRLASRTPLRSLLGAARSAAEPAAAVRTATTPFLTVPDVTRILVVKLDHIGDFVLGLPAFRVLRDAFPAAEVTLLCGPWNRTLAETSGCFDRVVCLSLLPEASAEHNPSGAGVDLEAVRQLQLPSFDIAIDFRDCHDTNRVLTAVEARYRAGFRAPETAALLDLAFPGFDLRMLPGERTHHLVLQMLLASAVVAVHQGGTMLHRGLEAIAGATAPFDLVGAGPGPRIGINMGSGSAEKNWPAANFQSLAEALVARLGATIVLFGAGREAAESARLAAALPPGSVVDLTDRLPLLQALATMRGLDLYIGNDTGTTHIAAALSVPTLCLFGTATTFDSHGVLGARSVSILAAAGGMGSITTEDAIRAVTDLLSRHRPAAT